MMACSRKVSPYLHLGNKEMVWPDFLLTLGLAAWASRSGLAKDQAGPHVTLGQGPRRSLPYSSSGEQAPMCTVSLKPSLDTLVQGAGHPVGMGVSFWSVQTSTLYDARIAALGGQVLSAQVRETDLSRGPLTREGHSLHPEPKAPEPAPQGSKAAHSKNDSN